MESGEDYSLFETRKDKGRHIRRIYAISLFVAICFIWAYRLSHIPAYGKWAWLGLFAAELWSGFYWLFGQALRWNMLFRKTFINRLSERYENSLPRVDMFVFTADPIIEPPMMVINTVLSVMAYDYPAEKLSVYLSDDAGSDITFYALLEASTFAKHWVPFCKRFKVEPRSPAAYFNTLVSTNSHDHNHAKDLDAIKKLYVDMKRRIEDVVKLGGVPSEARSKHNGFSQWDSYYSRHDHDTILQILLHERNPHNSKDVDGFVLPTLVYMAREKRPQYHHNYKAGAINSLLRVSSRISNAKIILIIDCDMYSNHSQSVRDALCFFMDEEKGQEIAFVQFPQNFENLSKNDLYGNAISATVEMSSPWFIPFAYVILGESSSTLIEGLISGGTIKGWWNDLRMWLYIRTSSYLFALIDIVWKFFGRSYSSFAVTTKIVEDDDVSQRYKNEVMEFGTSSPFFTVLATLALLHLFCLLATIKELVLCKVALTGEKMALQVLLCGFLVLINFPIYQGLFLRKDKGRLPSSHTIKSTTLALSACIFFKIWN